jgi:hypothetical protein
MKSLSIKQPWAQLIASGIKDIENRKWKTHFRGRIYIHASAKIMDVEFTDNQIKTLSENNINYSGAGYPIKWKTVSAIIGEVEIIDCVVNHHSNWAEKTKGEYVGDGVFVLSEKPIYNWVLANPVLYDKPILNVKGKLSFWEFKCEHKNIDRKDGLDECLDCGVRNY